MKFTHKLFYPRSVEETVQMMRDQRFHALRDQQLRSHTQPVEVTDGAFVIRTTAQVDASALPAAVRKFAKGAPTVEVEERWDADEASARTAVKIGSFPVSVSFDSQLLPAEGGCERRLEGDVSVRIPLVGAKLEKQAVAHIDQINAIEARAAEQYWDGQQAAQTEESVGGSHE